MAKFLAGPAASAISGSQGGTVYSRNRYGAYTRSRVVPVNPNSAAQQQARADLASQSTAWGALTSAQQLAWKTWAANNPIVDRLGQSQILAGNAAFIQLNSRLSRSGDTVLTSPPVTPAPNALTTLAFETDIGTADFELNFTPTPLAAGLRLWCLAAVVDSAGINYVTNLLRLTNIEAAATASPVDNQTNIEAVFGTLAAGMVVHQFVSVFDSATGLLSTPRRVSGTVTNTP